MSRPARVSPDRILAAAAVEFARHGYAGARVEGIARRARVNKAMLYYHFQSKQRLYRTLLRQLFTDAGARLQTIADSAAPPGEKFDAVVRAMSALVAEHAHFPAIMLREIAEGAAHMDRDTLAAMVALPRIVAGIVDQGVASGTFRATNPFFAYIAMVAPIIFFRASAPMRADIAGRHLSQLVTLGPEEFLESLQDALRRTLACEAAPCARPIR